MASTTERKLVVRGRPTPAGSGISGSSTAHSASVVSLAKRSPSRRYCARVISVQDMVLSIESSQIYGITSRWNHSLLFGQPLRLLPGIELVAHSQPTPVAVGARPSSTLANIQVDREQSVLLGNTDDAT